jgi:hypothetical protein
MKNALLLRAIILTVCLFFPNRGWTGGMHFGGVSGSGHFNSQGFSGSHHFGGNVYRNFGTPGPYTNYGSPAFRPPGFGYSPYCPPSYFGSQHSYRYGVPFFSPGLSSRRFVYRQQFMPAGPPPVGAPGPTPFAPATQTRASTSFYCVTHGFHYTDQNAFFGHLNFAHHVPLQHAAAYCQQVENGLIFSGD